MLKNQISGVIWKILLIAIVQTSALFYLIASRNDILSSDTLIILETRPVDPRSLFRGDFVRLYYEINELQLENLQGDKAFKTNDLIYVVVAQLDKSAPYWTAVAAYDHYPLPSEVPSREHVIIQGVVKNVADRHWNRSVKPDKGDPVDYAISVTVSYGIESYFVPEGEGLRLERPKPGDKITLEIAVADNGQMAIKTLLLNDKALYQESIF